MNAGIHGGGSPCPRRNGKNGGFVRGASRWGRLGIWGAKKEEKRRHGLGARALLVVHLGNMAARVRDGTLRTESGGPRSAATCGAQRG